MGLVIPVAKSWEPKEASGFQRKQFTAVSALHTSNNPLILLGLRTCRRMNCPEHKQKIPAHPSSDHTPRHSGPSNWLPDSSDLHSTA